mmetsp:Transcript_12995/g.30478  ORF Transcript_12995/g.30478 Transcript_12995/m.30478 type:complete len:390 (+) Transcript_12995:286-1455(+)
MVQREAVHAEVYTSGNCACDCIDLAVLMHHAPNRCPPNLRHLRLRGSPLQRLKPGLMKRHARIQEELGQASRSGKLAQVEYHALPFRDQCKVAGEIFCKLHEGMVGPRDRNVLHATTGSWTLLPGLDCQLRVGHEQAVGRAADLGLAYHKPLTSRPCCCTALFLLLPFTHIQAASHAHDGLRVLTHRQLLEVDVSLEKHLPRAGAGEPRWLEALRLHRALPDRVQREACIDALGASHLQCQRKVLEIDSSCRVARRGQLQLLATQHQAILAPARRPLRLPAHVVIRSYPALQHLICTLPRIFAALQALQRILCNALSVQQAFAVAAAHCVVAQGQVAMAAEEQVLAIRVHNTILRPIGVPRVHICKRGTRLLRGALRASIFARVHKAQH